MCKNVFFSGENRKILHDRNVEKALTDLLMQENESVSTAVCQAVAAVSKNLSSKETFRCLGNLIYIKSPDLFPFLIQPGFSFVQFIILSFCVIE